MCELIDRCRKNALLHLLFKQSFLIYTQRAKKIVSIKWKEINMAAPNEVLKDALNLRPAEKADLIDKLLSSLDNPDKELDELWAKEAEDRIEGYDHGKIKALTLKEVLEKYR
jgi:putative addiction module component (TIGR02574 family)